MKLSAWCSKTHFFKLKEKIKVFNNKPSSDMNICGKGEIWVTNFDECVKNWKENWKFQTKNFLSWEGGHSGEIWISYACALNILKSSFLDINVTVSMKKVKII